MQQAAPGTVHPAPAGMPSFSMQSERCPHCDQVLPCQCQYGKSLIDHSEESDIEEDIDEDEAKKALDKVKSENLTYQIIDVSNFEKIKQQLENVENSHGKIDIFINNAGLAGMNTTVADYPIEEWNKVINLNLNAVFYCCKAVVPLMKKNNYGRIVNIASIAGKEGNPNASAYST